VTCAQHGAEKRRAEVVFIGMGSCSEFGMNFVEKDNEEIGKSTKQGTGV
jgi:hypothetical protein